MMPRTALASGIALALACASEPALAQYQMVSPMLYNGPVVSLQDHANRSRTTTTPDRDPPNAAQLAQSLTFRPDPARRRANLAQFVEKVRASDPQSAANLASLFAQGDIIALIQTKVSSYGFRIENIADAYATYWVSAYKASQGDPTDPSKGQMSAVKAQAARAIGATPAFAGAGDAAKQEMSEALWLQAVLLGGALDDALGKPDQMQLVASAATQGAAGMGIDLSHMTLTETGFVPKR